ncbi:cupin domain-containing protein [Streptomyces sp. NPDC050095]|uniref:JmjC domain-containing protein n=1 Tax=unclassified Streptomyces TaxID=2593676 RepID=UPI00342747C2
MAHTLTRLVAKPDEIAEAWPTVPLLHTGDERDFVGLPTLDEVDALIDTNCLTSRQTVLVKDGRLVDRKRYAKGDRLVPGFVREHIDTGGTLSLRRLHETFPGVALFCRSLAEELGHPVQANAYLTPPGQQGFQHHWDTHAVIIVQLHGAKRWELFEPVVTDPTEPDGSWSATGFTDEQREHFETGEPFTNPTLLPGDVLWVPRGWVHNPRAATCEGPSLHITFGVLEYTRHWIARQLIDQAASDVTQRAALPPNPDVAAAVDETRYGLLRWLEALDGAQAQQLVQQVIDHQHRERFGLPESRRADP